MEAMVFPDDRDRWSDGWAGDNTPSNTQANLPGTQLQDDIASGDRPLEGDSNPLDRARYPDFAIVNTGGRYFRYRQLYMVNMTTNSGDQDLQDGRVIYSMQPTRKALSDGQQDYCSRRGSDYDNCQFSTVDLCWAQGRISSVPIYSRRDWGAITGFLTRLAQAEREFPNAITGRKVDRFCDPRPPGSGDT